MQRITPEITSKIVKSFHPNAAALSIAKADDAAAIIALGQKIFSYNPPTLREIIYSLTKAHSVTFVLKDQSDVLIAYASYEGHMKRKCLYLNTIAVDNNARGRGLGKILYALGDSLAMALNANAIYCHVRPDNALNIKILENAKYQLLRVEKEYYDDSSNAYVYKKSFC